MSSNGANAILNTSCSTDSPSTTPKRANPGPSMCIYEPSHNNMFRVLYRRGKSFTSGGYGIDCHLNSNDLRHQEKFSPNDKATNSNVNIKSSHQTTYLFIEETLFLHERGLLMVFHPNGIDSMSSHDLFQLLEEQGVPLPIYLTYAHLRSQAYIVLRHINLQQYHQEEEEENKTTTTSFSNGTTTGESFNKIDGDIRINKHQQRPNNQKLYLRRKRLNAPPPKMLCNEFAYNCRSTCGLQQQYDASSYIAFDMFNPNSKFRKSNPGKPDFFITVSYFNGGQRQTPTFHSLIDIVQVCQGTPLRLG
jgi:hypothetical protein